MSAQTEEVVASAASLAGMAQMLDALVARSRIDASAAAGSNVVLRRRASDWQHPEQRLPGTPASARARR